jgi:hypothetical protein
LPLLAIDAYDIVVSKTLQTIEEVPASAWDIENSTMLVAGKPTLQES